MPGTLLADFEPERHSWLRPGTHPQERASSQLEKLSDVMDDYGRWVEREGAFRSVDLRLGKAIGPQAQGESSEGRANVGVRCWNGTAYQLFLYQELVGPFWRQSASEGDQSGLHRYSQRQKPS